MLPPAFVMVPLAWKSPPIETFTSFKVWVKPGAAVETHLSMVSITSLKSVVDGPKMMVSVQVNDPTVSAEPDEQASAAFAVEARVPAAAIAMTATAIILLGRIFIVRPPSREF